MVEISVQEGENPRRFKPLQNNSKLNLHPMNEYRFEIIYQYGSTEEITISAPSRFMAEIILIETYSNIKHFKFIRK